MFCLTDRINLVVWRADAVEIEMKKSKESRKEFLENLNTLMKEKAFAQIHGIEKQRTVKDKIY